ncbi:MAG: hypothetical protein OEW64_11240 [Gammaproteobacteria bacterium]|nr:hypothetical protein [Gammaproteobacteria bacterium]MDH5304652.1 hypothetical protein [Gammaproteobacteria bacterium]
MNTKAQESVSGEVSGIMLAFADRTGLSSSRHPPRRYLWTDAHAVCNFLSLYRRTGSEEYRQLAVMLIDQVHNDLGKHRNDDARSGWLSGLGDKEGSQHPTAGGLRIGKQLPERGPDDVFDERLEWDRDGQYYHYLTKWMHALCRAGTVCNEPVYIRWAMELAAAAHAGFAVRSPPDGRMRFVWKMSIDLTTPLVPSSSLHDSLDGYLTYIEIAHCASRLAASGPRTGLGKEILDAAGMIRGRRWYSSDPLGIGGLLFDACRTLQLLAAGQIGHPALATTLLQDASESLLDYRRQANLGQAAKFRLAFRELGLSTGLHALSKMRAVLSNRSDPLAGALRDDLAALGDYEPMAGIITGFWRDSVNQQADSWREHEDINSVMLATSLLPGEFLEV